MLDGLALLTASMEFFLHKPAHECPKIMVSTHYSELVRKFSAMAGVQTLSMQFIVTEHTDETNIDDLVFLFKYVFQGLKNKVIKDCATAVA